MAVPVLPLTHLTHHFSFPLATANTPLGDEAHCATRPTPWISYVAVHTNRANRSHHHMQLMPASLRHRFSSFKGSPPVRAAVSQRLVRPLRRRYTAEREHVCGRTRCRRKGKLGHLEFRVSAAHVEHIKPKGQDCLIPFVCILAQKAPHG